MLKLIRHSQTNEIMGRDDESGNTFWLIDYVIFGSLYEDKHPGLAQRRLREIAEANGRDYDDTLPAPHA